MFICLCLPFSITEMGNMYTVFKRFSPEFFLYQIPVQNITLKSYAGYRQNIDIQYFVTIIFYNIKLYS